MITDLNKIAAIFISSFDMDIQRYLKKIIEELNKTKQGQIIAQWSKSNSLKFNVILHLMSIAIQYIPDRNLLLNTVKSQLLRLPSEFINVVNNQSESSKANDYLDPDLNNLSTGVKILRKWEMQKLKQNKPDMSLYDFLDNAHMFGQLFKYANNEHSLNLLKEEMIAELDKPEVRFKMSEDMKKLHPELSADEISKQMKSSDYNDAQRDIIDMIISLPDLYTKAATEIEKLNLEIKTKIKGKDKNQSIEIFKSVYKNQISNYISELIKNKSLNDVEKQWKIDKQLKYYGEIVEMCESFK